MHVEELLKVASTVEPDGIRAVRDHLDPLWIEEALTATGTASLRRRRLPAEQVVWLVIGMALYRRRSIAEVAASLDIALPGNKKRSAAPSALVQARGRLGAEPMQWLFEKTARTWARPGDDERWRGLALYAIDGSKLAVADTDENAAHFGRHRTGKEKTASGYPLLRMVWLMSPRSRLLAGVRFGAYATAELTFAKELVAEVPEDALLILDRLYHNSPALLPVVARQNRNFLVKVKKHALWKLLRALGPGDSLVEVTVSDEARAADSSLPRTYVARCIDYRTEMGHCELLTSLLDPGTYPADEVRALYHDRWEVELGYDEFKTDMLEHEEALRSRTVENVQQELWGALLAYNLVRLEMRAVAKEADVVPNRISFVATLWRIRDEWQWCAVASPGAIPRHLRNLRADLRRFILPPRRSERRYPRVVKLKDSPYPRKRSDPQRGILN